MNTTANKKQETLVTVKCALAQFGLRQTARNVWERQTQDAVMTVTLQDEDGLSLCGDWRAGEFRDVTFFDLGDTGGLDTNSVEALVSWAAWYAGGSRMTTQGTIGYVNPEAATA